MYSESWPVEYINSVNAGFNASLNAREWTVAPGVDVEVVQPPLHNIPVAQYLREYVNGMDDNSSLLVVLGPMGEKGTSTSYSVLEEHGLVGFAPLTGAAGFETFFPHLYFLRPGLSSELMALIRYAAIHLRVLRLGFMYLEGMMGGRATYEQAVGFMSRMGQEFCCVFTAQNPLSREFEAAWGEFAKGRPQAVIVIATIKKETKEFIGRLVADERTADAFLLVPSLLQKSIVLVWKEALETAGAPFVPRRVIQTGTNPLACDNDSRSIGRFRVDMKNYLRKYGGWNGFDDPEHFLKNDVDGELMVAGWIAGEVLSQALRSHGWMNNRTAFLDSLYEQRRYLIDNIVVGDFGGVCGDDSVEGGAICNCNRGGRRVYMKEIVENYRLQPLVRGFITHSPLDCNGNVAILQPSLSGVSLCMVNREELKRSATQYELGVVSATAATDKDDVNRVFLQSVPTNTHNVSSDLAELQQNRIVTAVFGVVTEAVLGLSSLVFIDPITPTPHLNSFNSNVIHLSPTLEQQLYVHATYLSSIGVGYAHCVIRSEAASDIIGVMKKTLVTFGMNLSSVNVLEAEESIGGNFPGKGDLFLIGLIADDIIAVEKHLRTHAGARVFVQFADVALLYNEFVNTFTNSDSAKRLVFATSLPHWADANTTSDTVRRFHSVVPKLEQWTPLALLGFATGRLMERNLLRMDKVTPDLVSTVFFDEAVIIVDDMRYGAFRHHGCIAERSVDDGCASNFGAVDISVWSMERVVRSEEPALYTVAFPPMVYTVPSGGALTSAQLIGVVSGSSLVGLLLMGLATMLYFTWNSGRDNDNAPRDPTDPVTLIFTDVESSTALWAAHPNLMPDAVATHHSLIRSLISHHGCYEVKTVGDSFMIACRCASTAVQLARDLQVAFVECDWGTTTLDEFYRGFEIRKVDDIDGYVPPTAHLDHEVYTRYWNGLRVRVGVHTGLCDIRRDDVTKGYDYYGQTPNLAARAENVTNGGQVLLTRATYLALSAEERELLNVTALGPVALRGVPELVEMYQLNAVPGRTFAALRLDRVIDALDDGGDGLTASGSDHNSTLVELSESAQAIASSLQTVLGAFTSVQRNKTLMLFCERWRVTLPRGMGVAWDDNRCQEVIHHVAAKVGHVVDFHPAGASEQSLSTLSSESVILISSKGIDFDKF